MTDAAFERLRFRSEAYRRWMSWHRNRNKTRMPREDWLTAYRIRLAEKLAISRQLEPELRRRGLMLDVRI